MQQAQPVTCGGWGEGEGCWRAAWRLLQGSQPLAQPFAETKEREKWKASTHCAEEEKNESKKEEGNEKEEGKHRSHGRRQQASHQRGSAAAAGTCVAMRIYLRLSQAAHAAAAPLRTQGKHYVYQHM